MVFIIKKYTRYFFNVILDHEIINFALSFVVTIKKKNYLVCSAIINKNTSMVLFITDLIVINVFLCYLTPKSFRFKTA